MPSTETPLLFIIGPSGCGKSSLVRALHRRAVVKVHPTWTTRPRRPDEGPTSVEHRFISEAAFEALDQRGFFVETAQPFGLPYRYGLPPIDCSPAGPVDLVMLRAPFVEEMAALVPRCLVYQISACPAQTDRRLRARGSTPTEVAARMDDNQWEMAAGRLVADRVFVNDGPLAALVDRVAAALAADLAGKR